MFKLLGHFLALAAMTASVINAQCAVSCSLHSSSRSPSSEASPANLGGSDHSCCPHRRAPGPTQPKDNPCHRTVAIADNVRLNDNSISFNSIPLGIVVGWSQEYGPQFGKTPLDSLTAPDPPGPSQPLLVSILRV
jgi:hypothetical protein